MLLQRTEYILAYEMDLTKSRIYSSIETSYSADFMHDYGMFLQRANICKVLLQRANIKCSYREINRIYAVTVQRAEYAEYCITNLTIIPIAKKKKSNI